MIRSILTDGPRLDEILSLETSVWQAMALGDRHSDEKVLCDSFLGVYPSGFAGKADHCGQLQDGPVVAEYRLSSARLRCIGNAAALLSYRATFRSSGSADWKTMLISSLWEKEDGKWLNTFSQDTPETGRGMHE
ncbi:nuclear transport factor 2 family protein [Leisingera sp. S132]|uniref:nuclear transport factor 2 family protein n=1 Tax=Leisingera sp. S132 TaxID=2867016 RepID=UPI0021A7EB5E|nr:nuclear transport factor 2 family protein [Leisingera sp. S132]UWQ80625.1 nuclear transport factor 2 family protein [Leisingera sp. S132]